MRVNGAYHDKLMTTLPLPWTASSPNAFLEITSPRNGRKNLTESPMIDGYHQCLLWFFAPISEQKIKRKMHPDVLMFCSQVFAVRGVAYQSCLRVNKLRHMCI